MKCVYLWVNWHIIVDVWVFPYLTERLIKLLQDALLIKHLALVSVLIIVMDFLSEVGRQLVEGHILLHLFVLRENRMERDNILLIQCA